MIEKDLHFYVFQILSNSYLCELVCANHTCNFCNVETEDADLTWLFIVMALVAIIAAMIFYYVFSRICAQKELTEQVEEERARGLVPEWGTRMQVPQE